MKKTVMGFVLLLGVMATAEVQSKKVVNILSVAASGAVSANRYTNSFFKLTVDAPNATLQLNPFMNAPAERARLVQILAKPVKWEDTYTFGVGADSLAKYPNLQSTIPYVRSARHLLEKEGLPTVREEFPMTIGGVQFTGAILQEQVPGGQKYYRGIYTTFRNGYALTFDVEATSERTLNQLVARLVTFAK